MKEIENFHRDLYTFNGDFVDNRFETFDHNLEISIN